LISIGNLRKWWAGCYISGKVCALGTTLMNGLFTNSVAFALVSSRDANLEM
jgi:hypothetical protein